MTLVIDCINIDETNVKLKYFTSFYCNWMKQSLLFILTASILVRIAVGIVEIQGTDAATNLNSAKSNIHRDISVQANGDDSQATFE
jgi:uncharacterized protein with ParB-like and HNH nuclease domain